MRTVRLVVALSLCAAVASAKSTHNGMSTNGMSTNGTRASARTATAAHSTAVHVSALMAKNGRLVRR